MKLRARLVNVPPPAGYKRGHERQVLVTVKVMPHQMVQYPPGAAVHQVRKCSDVHGTYHWHEFTVGVHPADEALVIVLPKWHKQ